MLNATNKNIALAIATAYCNNDMICKESLFNRLNKYLNDSSFPKFLSDLTSKKYGVAKIQLPLITNPYYNYYAGNIFLMDIISGSSGIFPFYVLKTKYNPNVTDWKTTLENINIARLQFEYILENEIVYSSSEHGGYPIAYTTDPTISGGDPGGGDPGGGGLISGNGTIIIKKNPGSPALEVPVEKVFSGFDYQSLLVPGAIILAAYFLLGKN